MSQTKTKNSVAPSRVILAEEHFWKCYSPRGEFPLSTVISFVVHGLVFGLVLLIGVLAAGGGTGGGAGGGIPNMDVVPVEGGGGVGGTGGDGFGKAGDGTADKEGDPNGENPQENVKQRTEIAGGPEFPRGLEPNPQTELNPVERPEVTIAEGPGVAAPVAASSFGGLLEDASKFANKLENGTKNNQTGSNTKGPRKGGKTGSGSPGSGGGKGGGDGTGVGKGSGPGSGTGKGQGGWRVSFSAYANKPASFITTIFRKHQVMIAIPTGKDDQYYYADMSVSRPVARLVSKEWLLKKNVKITWGLFNNNPSAQAEIQTLVRAVRAPVRKPPKLIVCFFGPQKEEQLLRLLRTVTRDVPLRKIAYAQFDFRSVGNEVRLAVTKVVRRR